MDNYSLIFMSIFICLIFLPSAENAIHIFGLLLTFSLYFLVLAKDISIFMEKVSSLLDGSLTWMPEKSSVFNLTTLWRNMWKEKDNKRLTADIGQIEQLLTRTELCQIRSLFFFFQQILNSSALQTSSKNSHAVFTLPMGKKQVWQNKYELIFCKESQKNWLAAYWVLLKLPSLFISSLQSSLYKTMS